MRSWRTHNSNGDGHEPKLINSSLSPPLAIESEELTTPPDEDPDDILIPPDDADTHDEEPGESKTTTQHGVAANVFLQSMFEQDGFPTLIYWRGDFWAWTNNRDLLRDCGQLIDPNSNDTVGFWYAPITVEVFSDVIRSWLFAHDYPSSISYVNEVLATIRSKRRVSDNLTPPLTLLPTRDHALGRQGAINSSFIQTGSGILDPVKRILSPSEPRYFSPAVSPLLYDDRAVAPRWRSFLASLFGGSIDREECEALLQEWFGYCLTSYTHAQKILMMVGAPRSGKGTIVRVLSALVGAWNHAAVSVYELCDSFGLEILLHKTLATLGEIHIAKDKEVVRGLERLKMISGEDAVPVNRKYKESLTVRLGVRFVISANEFPSFPDSSSAFKDRLLILPMETSFTGKENSRLTHELLEELPGIFNWALDGLQRWKKTERFTVPNVSRIALVNYHLLANPINAFVNDCCDVEGNYAEDTDTLWQAWQVWCKKTNTRPTTRGLFLLSLKASIPNLTVRQLRIPAFISGLEDYRTRACIGIRLKLPEGAKTAIARGLIWRKRLPDDYSEIQ